MSTNGESGSAVDPLRIPESRRGRRSESDQVKYDAWVDAFVVRMLEIKSRLDFEVGARGWCYLLENALLIGKGDFDRMECLIGDWRKDGRLPLDFCANDEKRAPLNLEEIDKDTPEEYAQRWLEVAAKCEKHYVPFSFWDFQPVYLEMAVEKVDLRNLFGPVCAEYHVPIWNAGGWSDINSRKDLMIRFRKHAEQGQRCVLLYCGDFDPAGLHISEKFRKNLRDLEGAVGWSPDEDRLIIDRFGLNHDFIVANNLLWIDGLETGGGKGNLEEPDHNDHNKPYVQNYLKLYGSKKVEANALVVRPVEGRQLCREAIEQYVYPDGIKKYQRRLAAERRKVSKALPKLAKAMFGGSA